MNPRNIKFTVTEIDYIKYTKFACDRLNVSSKSRKLIFWKDIILWFSLGLILVGILRHNSVKITDFHWVADFHWPTAFVVAIPFALFIFFVAFSLRRFQRISMPNSNGLLLGERALEFHDDGITETSSLGHAFYKWNAVEDVSSNNGDIYIFLDKLLAQIIPSSCFKNEEEIAELMMYLNKQKYDQQLHQTSYDLSEN